MAPFSQLPLHTFSCCFDGDSLIGHRRVCVSVCVCVCVCECVGALKEKNRKWPVSLIWTSRRLIKRKKNIRRPWREGGRLFSRMQISPGTRETENKHKNDASSP